MQKCEVVSFNFGQFGVCTSRHVIFFSVVNKVK